MTITHLLAAAVAVVVLTGPASAADPPTNTICPVTDEPVEQEIFTVYKGRRVQFCCTTCAADFKRDPSHFIRGLPQFANLSEEEDAARSAVGSTGGEVGAGLPAGSLAIEAPAPAKLEKDPRPILRVIQRVWPWLGLSAALFVAWQVILRKREGALVKLGWETVLYLQAMALLILGLAFVRSREVERANVAQVQTELRYWKNTAETLADRDYVHFSTYYDFGSPPIPDRPDRPKQLGGTFYRGNDERNPRLFNGGFYRTSVLKLSLVDDQGATLAVGDKVAGRKLFVRFEIERAPFTPDHFFNDGVIKTIFLTRDGRPFLGGLERAEDRLDLTMQVPQQKWIADYPLPMFERRADGVPNIEQASVEELAQFPGVGQLAATWLVAYREYNHGIRSSADIRAAGIEGGALQALSKLLADDGAAGVIYVAQTMSRGGKPRGARFHYGIVYELRVNDGVLTAESDLWMNFLYRSRKIARTLIPDEQWFSTQPIPELPAKGTDDPVLLGLDEYQ